MKKITSRLAFIAAIAGIITISSCSKDKPTPTPEPAQEEYDAARIQFIALDASGNQTTDTTTVNFGKDGVPSPSHSHLAPGGKYRTLITLFYKGNSINQEIIDEGTEHKFFFIPSVAAGVTNFVYNDKDKDNRGIGLDGTMTIGSGEFDLKIVLRHALDKSKPEAQAWNSPNYTAAGGEDDLNVAFEIHAE
ncbi:hypothetical protein [Taibaiella chishuiensis]|uniref:Type 1 periplasmic binding fold superfamily protein n=1 Tax=Taibaiella chishuiensis TaxID=1434707 RepID=A0A2P8DBP0_9BACT|nr:hypothetical protein [Taibaiella chishuiensis]PSK94595.1 hypothetical protein B0I18_101751 [Taibaiella chishuiensis]